MRSQSARAYGLVGLVLVVLSCAPPKADPAPTARRATTVPSTPTTDAREDCSGPLPSEAELLRAAEGKEITVDELLRDNPAAGRFTVTGYMRVTRECPSCAETAWVTAAFGAGLKQPLVPTSDLIVRVADTAWFAEKGFGRVTVAICPRQDTRTHRPELELRAYRPHPGGG